VDDLGPLVLRAVRLVTVRPDLKPLAEDVEHEEPTLDLDLPDLLRKSCMALAAELVALRVNWRETDPEKVLGAAPDQGKAQAVIRLFEKLTRT
jgi:hypothetical protein